MPPSYLHGGLLVGVLHLPPLPGSPRAHMTMREIAAQCAADARALASGGYDFIMVENFGDAPFFRGRVPAVTVSAMTACALAVRDAAPSLALGVNVLRNDADAALSIAHVVGARAIRVNVHAGARVTDQGIVEGDAAETLRTRRALGANVEVWADVDVKHSAALAPRVPADGAAPRTAAWSAAEEAKDLVARALADAVLVTGEGTGRPVDVEKLAAVRAAVPGARVLVASGAVEAQLPVLAAHANGVVVGSAIRANGAPGGPIDAARAADFARAFRAQTWRRS